MKLFMSTSFIIILFMLCQHNGPFACGCSVGTPATTIPTSTSSTSTSTSTTTPTTTPTTTTASSCAVAVDTVLTNAIFAPDISGTGTARTFNLGTTTLPIANGCPGNTFIITTTGGHCTLLDDAAITGGLLINNPTSFLCSSDGTVTATVMTAAGSPPLANVASIVCATSCPTG